MQDIVGYWNKISAEYEKLENNLKQSMIQHIDVFFKETGLKPSSFVITMTKDGKICFMEDIKIDAPGGLEVYIEKRKS